MINFPTSASVGVTRGLLTDLQSDIMSRDPENVSLEMKARAWAIASVATLVFGAVDVLQNAACILVKIVPVLFCETIGKLAELSQPEAFTVADLDGHRANIGRSLLMMMNAVSVFFGLESPELLLKVAKKVELIGPYDKNVTRNA